MAMDEAEITQDAFLGGRVMGFQPRRGFRAGLDTVCLAAAVAAGRGGRILDAGAGAGIAGLCLLARAPQMRLTALEREPDMAALAARNFVHNGCDAECLSGDLLDFQPGAPFDQVMTNPPFGLDGAGSASSHAQKDRAMRSEAGLGPWLSACLRLLAPKGYLTLVCRADQVDAAMAALAAGAGDIRLFPLWPRAGQPAKRVLLRARKSVKSPAVVLPGLVLHAAERRFTPEAEAVLRNGGAIDLDAA